jgi:hypothetical protein
MVDFTYPVRWFTGQITDIHHSAKTIERFNFGKVYTIAYDNYFDYYVVQPLVRPLFNKIATHQKTVYTIGACLLVGLILIKAHPLRKNENQEVPEDPESILPPDAEENKTANGSLPEADISILGEGEEVLRDAKLDGAEDGKQDEKIDAVTADPKPAAKPPAPLAAPPAAAPAAGKTPAVIIEAI